MCFLLSFTHPIIHSRQVLALNDRPALPGHSMGARGSRPCSARFTITRVCVCGGGRMMASTHKDIHDSDEGMKLVGQSHSCKGRPPGEGVPAVVKMPPPGASGLFTPRCQAPPPTASWESPHLCPHLYWVSVLSHRPQSWVEKEASSRREVPRLPLGFTRTPFQTPPPRTPAPKRGL